MNKKKAAVITGGIIWVIFFVAGLLISFDCFGIISSWAAKMYPEAVILPEEFTPPKAYLKDFSQNDDGSITSDSADPWLYVNFYTNGLTNLHTLEVNVSSASNLEESIPVYYADSYQMVSFKLKKGCNRVSLRQATEKDNGLRLDLTSCHKQTLKIDSIIINNNGYLTIYYGRKFFSLTMCFLWVSVLLALSLSPVKEKLRKILSEKLPGIPWDKFPVQKQKASNSLFKISLGCSCILGIVTAFCFSWQIDAEKLFWEYDLGNLLIWMVVCLISYLAVTGHLSAIMFTLLYMAVHGCFQYYLNDESIGYYLEHMYFKPMLALNVLLFLLLVLMFQKLLGTSLGNLIFGLVFGLYLMGNVIKMKYQNALFSSADFALAGEIAGIARQYVTLWMAGLFFAVLIFVVVLCVRFQKKLKKYFKPHFSWSGILSAICFALFASLVLCNSFKSLGIDTKKEYLTNKEQLNAMGFGMYTLLELSGKQNTGEPEGYDESIVAEIEQYKEHSTEQKIKPTVLLILAESLFQVEEIEGVSFNAPLTTNLAPYKVCNVISPSYGGRTAAAEFESLTGLSNLFISGDAIPYTTYFKRAGNDTGSIAREFHDNGYITYAVHANRADYYSRDTAYENLGFDNFISKEDFILDGEDYLEDNLVKDETFVDMILQVLVNSQEPVFLFGASLEGHSPYGEKYTTTEIQAESETYSDGAIQELSKYGQAVYNFDTQMGRIIDYFETSQEPVLIYVYGDHLPPLLINSEDGYLNDEYLKYSTPLYAYSNFCDISVDEEYLSLSQVAPEILRKSGINYRAYFDYIYQLRKKYPITHKNITDGKDSEELSIYRKLQWDLLRGQRYLLE